MKSFIIILLLSLFTSVEALSQVRGVIVDDKTNERLPGAAVSLLDSMGLKLSSVGSNSRGVFRLSQKDEAVRLHVQLLGYQDVTLDLPLADSIVRLTPSAVQGEQVTVTANRVATAVQDLAISTVVVQSPEIQDRSPQGLDNILRAIPGVTVTESQVSIRGSSGYARAVGSRVLLLMDGMPFLSGDNGDMKFDAIPFPAIDRIEVIKGGGSALYGSNAIGGVVNVLTRDPREVWKSGVSVTGGYYDWPKYEEWRVPELNGRFYQLDAGIENKWEQSGFLATGSYRRNEGYRLGDDIERYNIFAKGLYTGIPLLTLRGSALIAMDDHGGWLYWKSLNEPLMPTDSLTAIEGRTHSNRYNFLLNADYADGQVFWSNKLTYYSTKYVTEGVPARDDSGANSKANVLSFESFVNGDIVRQFNATLGVNANLYDVASSVLANQTAYGIAGFFQGEWRPLDDVSILPGVRFDLFKANNVESEQQVSPKFGINYRPTKEIALRGSLGTGFRVPTLTERFINSTLVGFEIVPNDTLKPEKSISYEVGAMYTDEMFTLDGAVFYATYENLIEPRFVGDKIQFQNLTKALQFGHEELVEYRPYTDDELKLRLGYTYVYSEDRESKQVLQYRPRHLIQGRAEWNPSIYHISSDFRYLSAYEATDSTLSLLVPDGDDRVGSYVLDVRAGINLKELIALPVKATIQIQNLLNYYYVEMVGNMGPLRSYSLKLETTL